MKYYFANTLFIGDGTSLNNIYLIVNNVGILIYLSELKPDCDLDLIISYDAILPSFANVHCHTELSYAYKKMEQNTGINVFINELEKLKLLDINKSHQSIAAAITSMELNGIAAVGDICNTTQSMVAKKQSNITFKNFIEVYGFSAHKAEFMLNKAKDVLNSFIGNDLHASLTPHAPYSVSQELMQLINITLTPQDICSIHMQESIAENDFFAHAQGSTFDRLKSYGIDLTNFKPNCKSALPYFVNFLQISNPWIFVHNTFTNAEDIEIALEKNTKIAWCLCPNANKFIENTLPNIPLLMSKKLNIVLGTDSLASNDKLCILSEMQSIQKHYNFITANELIHWATSSGFKALGLESTFGSIILNKKVKLNAFINYNHQNNQQLAHVILKVLN